MWLVILDQSPRTLSPGREPDPNQSVPQSSPIRSAPKAALDVARASFRSLLRQGPVGLLPSVNAALNVTGGLQARVLRGLNRHRRPFAKGAIE